MYFEYKEANVLCCVQIISRRARRGNLEEITTGAAETERTGAESTDKAHARYRADRIREFHKEFLVPGNGQTYLHIY